VRGVRPRVVVVGSINLDLVARCERLPRPGETVTDAVFERIPGGKGANQAVAAARLGAPASMIGCVGDDDFAREALTGLEEAGVDLSAVKTVDGATGVAVILVDGSGENQIVVAPGANARLAAEDVDVDPEALVTLCQLEIPMEAVIAAGEQSFFFCLNAAPARALPEELGGLDLVIVNRYEHEIVGDVATMVAVTHGPEGAVLLSGGEEIARAAPPAVQAVDGTAAGDAFCAELALSLCEERPAQEALERACAAGAIAASRFGAQPSLPTADEVDAILAAA
jgi:ribokinase